MSFEATEFEFRNRFWFIAGIFFVGFWLYQFDRVNAAVELSRLALGGHPDESSRAFGHWITVFFALGTLLVAMGALVRSWAESYLHSSIVHDRELHGEKLVADGPYRHVRNPLYLGNLFLAFGVGFLASRLGFVVICAGMALFVYRLTLREEAKLVETQGESYRRYCAAVPRLLPALLPRVPAGGAPPNWLDGFTGEIFMWGGAAGMAVFTMTHSIAWFWIVFGVGWAVYFFQYLLRYRRKVPKT
jgi:protein-S-isoprenylcysteine O-methyltransferase Ste14